MRISLVFTLAVACMAGLSAESQAALNVTSVSTSTSQNAIVGDTYGAFNVTEAVNNQTVVGSNQFSLGKNGALGEYSYNYTYGTSSSTSGSGITLNVLTSLTTTAHSNQAVNSQSSEFVNGFINFSLTSTYQGTLNFTSILDLGTSDNNNVTVFGSLYKGDTILSEFARSIDTSGNTSDNSGDFPTQFMLGPGDYQIALSAVSARNGTFDVNNAGAAGIASLSLTSVAAVPEPASIVLWSCIAVGGLPKLRRYLKKRQGNEK